MVIDRPGWTRRADERVERKMEARRESAKGAREKNLDSSATRELPSSTAGRVRFPFAGLSIRGERERRECSTLDVRRGLSNKSWMMICRQV